MIKVTLRQLKEWNACQSGINWFNKRKLKSLKSIIPALLKSDHFDYARWLLPRYMSHTQKVQWAIYSAELVLKMYEKKHPENKRQRLAIQAAKDFLAGKINANAAANAATNADYAAANAAYAATDADYAAANAAYAAANAANAANAAAYAATNADYAAANAANAAARIKIISSICNKALEILGEI